MVILHREQIRADIKVAAYDLREGPAQGNRSFRYRDISYQIPAITQAFVHSQREIIRCYDLCLDISVEHALNALKMKLDTRAICQSSCLVDKN